MHSKKSANKQAKPNTLSFDATGTKWRISSYDEGLGALQPQILQYIANFESVYSRFNKNSLVSAMATQAGTYTFPRGAAKLFNLYMQLEDLTAGGITPLIGKNLNEAGYDAAYSLTPTSLTPNPRLHEVASCNGSVITTTQPLQFDFGAAAKGLLIDEITQLLRDNGLTRFSINAGGDIFTTIPRSIGLEHPLQPGALIGTTNIQGVSLCGSSGNRRNWGAYHHIISGTTLESPHDVVASWVVADSAMLADMIATALHLVSPDSLNNLFDYEYAIIDKSAQIIKKGRHFKDLH